MTVAINLNLDPRIKGQKLKGVFDYPISTGKSYLIAAYTTDPILTDQALAAGAKFAGDIYDDILGNKIQWPLHFERLIATKDLMLRVIPRKVLFDLNKANKKQPEKLIEIPRHHDRLATKLKRNKIIPSHENMTLVDPSEFVRAVRGYSNGCMVPYTTDSHGNVSTRIGPVNKATTEELVENFHFVLQHLFDTQAPVFGTGPRAKKGNIGKYIQGINIVASQGRPLILDLETIDILKERNHQTIPLTKKWRDRTE